MSLGYFQVAEQQGLLRPLAEAIKSLEHGTFDRNHARSVLNPLLKQVHFDGRSLLDQPIFSIDSCPNATDRANCVVDALSLTGTVIPCCADGQTLVLLKRSRVVLVASLAEPKSQIVGNLVQQLTDDNRFSIFVRSVERDTFWELLYRPVSEQELNLWALIKPRNHPRSRLRTAAKIKSHQQL
ncbi:hypothetical protein R1flu_012062 [Riccia fluitans]|uniref:Uncharacterized protein n=1 Tax=Riccia fluitans TaxID=41844 RepID=A0ABD1Z9I6_9MARC